MFAKNITEIVSGRNKFPLYFWRVRPGSKKKEELIIKDLKKVSDPVYKGLLNIWRALLM